MKAAAVAGTTATTTDSQRASSLASQSSSRSSASDVSIESIEAAQDTAESARWRNQQRTKYSVKQKRELIALAKTVGVRDVCRMEGVPRRTLRHWLNDAEKITSFEGLDSRKSIGRCGCRELVPFGRKLSCFLKQGQQEGKEMTSSHMMNFIRQNHQQWLESYMASKKSPESGHAALARLCQRFVERHGMIHVATDSDAMVSSYKGASVTASRELSLIEDHPLMFGLDIGTTAIKCVVVRADNKLTVAMVTVSLRDVMELGPHKNTPGVQKVDQILIAVQRAVAKLPEKALQRVISIGICGQMHGILWWCSRAVHESAERLLTTQGIKKWDDKSDDAVWTELVTWQDQRCSSLFLQACRETIGTSTGMGSSSRLATGYGLATFAHVLEHAPRMLVGMDACGTIQDFVAFVLCGHQLPSEAFIDTTDAHSWGGFDLSTHAWDSKVLQTLRIPAAMLPSVKKPGTCIGHTSAGCTGFGLPIELPVYVPMGDHPCSVLAAVTKQASSEARLTLVNIGTSAQVAMILSKSDALKLSVEETTGFEVRPFLFENYYVGVAASLSGGNIFAWFVRQWQQWIEEIGLTSVYNGDEEQIYARLIELGLRCQDTQLVIKPTLLGERADPDASGKIQNLRMNNWSMGDISAALCRGLIDNLFEMIPKALQLMMSSQLMIGTGNALVKNELLQRFLLHHLAQPSNFHVQTAVDAAVGASLSSSLQGGRYAV
ncbi:hypothetical protein CCR75_008259 [Bremia lactucae]|uniref:Carbohydrate kinase FGGY N-terminal domain-containing protein n=1 Tax=Bremia lactucae TaxID=4779 RepID=A0A976ILT9_BRELC|nr:hypothetical protein CCR75_008259 [Bremia lactucae]